MTIGFPPQGAFPRSASPYGARDMAGHLWEWTADGYLHDDYADAPQDNPVNHERSYVKTVRGGTRWWHERSSRATA